MPEHTNGPFTILASVAKEWDRCGDYAILDTDGNIIAETFGIVGAEMFPIKYIHRPAKANALLFAAAPRLLEACEAIYRVALDCSLPGPVHLSIAERNLLARAITEAGGDL